jgi:hypothetical protein
MQTPDPLTYAFNFSPLTTRLKSSSILQARIFPRFRPLKSYEDSDSDSSSASSESDSDSDIAEDDFGVGNAMSALDPYIPQLPRLWHELGGRVKKAKFLLPVEAPPPPPIPRPQMMFQRMQFDHGPCEYGTTYKQHFSTSVSSRAYVEAQYVQCLDI